MIVDCRLQILDLRSFYFFSKENIVKKSEIKKIAYRISLIRLGGQVCNLQSIGLLNSKEILFQISQYISHPKHITC